MYAHDVTERSEEGEHDQDPKSMTKIQRAWTPFDMLWGTSCMGTLPLAVRYQQPMRLCTKAMLTARGRQRSDKMRLNSVASATRSQVPGLQGFVVRSGRPNRQ